MKDAPYFDFHLTCSGNILKYLSTRGQTQVVTIQQDLGYSRQMIHRELKKLVASSDLIKSGDPPTVYYEMPDY